MSTSTASEAGTYSVLVNAMLNQQDNAHRPTAQ